MNKPEIAQGIANRSKVTPAEAADRLDRLVCQIITDVRKGRSSTLPSARAGEFRRVAAKLGFVLARHTGSHERWIHPDGRATTVPIHGGREIGPPLFHRILRQLGIDERQFERLR